MAAPRDYRRLSLAAKQAHALDRQREPALVCPSCETQTTAADLVQHLDRCNGPREPHPLSKWITWGEAMRLGVPRATMNQWVRRGFVRTRTRNAQGQGIEPQRSYLLRDLATRLAARRARRQFTNVNQRKK